jgi:uncharacterized membrane protein YdbT with pleckstrin-like domain
MSYIDGNLLAGERVVFRTRLHWKLLVAPLVFALATLLPIAWMLAQGTWNPLILIAPAIGLFVLLAAVMRRQSSDFAVTNKRVMMKVGIFSTRSVELLLGKIEAIAVHQTLPGRIFGYGDIVVTGSGGTEERFSDIQSPLALRRAVQSISDAPSDAGERRAPALTRDEERDG